MNKTTKLIVLPLFVGAIIGMYFLLTGQISWLTPLWFYIFFGIFINGTIAHRYFGHNIFVVPGLVRKILGILVAMGAYSTPLVWVLQHRHHHINSDKDEDMHSPVHGFWHSFIGWRLTGDINLFACANRRTVRHYLQDPALIIPTKYYFQIFWAWVILLAVIDYKVLLAGYCVGIVADFIRIGIANSVCHMPGLFGNYVTYNNKDQSQNNVFLGYLGGGMGWHNNHHKYPNRIILSSHWWEIDLEGYFGWIMSKVFRQTQKTTVS